MTQIRAQIAVRPRELDLSAQMQCMREERMCAWWYRGIQKNLSHSTEPLVQVDFRLIDESGNVSSLPRFRLIPLSSLNQVTMGSIWDHAGRCRTKVKTNRKQFLVDFGAAGWRFSKLADYPAAASLVYPQHGEREHSALVEFRTEENIILVPCIEFFYRCYGRSARLKQTLLSMPWQSDYSGFSASDALYARDNPDVVNDGVWLTTLPKNLLDSDVVFLAHARWNPATQAAVRRLYAELEVGFSNNASGLAFPKIGPWFDEVAEIEVAGAWVSDRIFLASQLLGHSHPQNGEMILRDRENSNKALKPADPDKAPLAFPWWRKRPLKIRTDGIPITDEDDPDHSGDAQLATAEPVKILGPDSPVEDVRKDQARYKSGKAKLTQPAASYSGGDPHGDTGGVGEVAMRADTEIMLDGAPYQLWRAFRDLARDPEIEDVWRVRCYTLEQGFLESDEPVLVSLRDLARRAGLDERKKKRKRRSRWLSLGRGAGSRSMLVMRIETFAKTIYAIEIQRRPQTRESFSVLAFECHDDVVSSWIARIGRALIDEYGVFKRVDDLPVGAQTTPHRHRSEGSNSSQYGTALNILRKFEAISKKRAAIIRKKKEDV